MKLEAFMEIDWLRGKNIAIALRILHQIHEEQKPHNPDSHIQGLPGHSLALFFQCLALFSPL